MPRTKGLTKDQIAEMIAMHNAGWSQRYIARKFNVAYSTVHYHLAKHNIRPRPKGGRKDEVRIPHQEIIEVVFLYQYCKLETNEIGRIMHMRPAAIRYRLQIGGVKLRDKNIEIKDRPQIDLSSLQAKYMAKAA